MPSVERVLARYSVIRLGILLGWLLPAEQPPEWSRCSVEARRADPQGAAGGAAVEASPVPTVAPA